MNNANENLGTVEVVQVDRTPAECAYIAGMPATTTPKALADALVLSNTAQDFVRLIASAIAESKPILPEQVRALRDACAKLVGTAGWDTRIPSVQIVNEPVQGPVERPAVPGEF